MSFLFDFGDGPVPAHQHGNGGGIVADSAIVEHTAYVGPGAQVCGNARVKGKAELRGSTLVRAFAIVRDYALVRNSVVKGFATVGGDATVVDSYLWGGEFYGKARIRGNSYVILDGMTEWNDVLTAYPLRDSTYAGDRWGLTLGCRRFTYEEALQHWDCCPDRARTLSLVKYLNDLFLKTEFKRHSLSNHLDTQSSCALLQGRGLDAA